MIRIEFSRRGLFAVVTVVAVVAAAGVAYAAIPSSSGVIRACYDKKGDLRVIDAEAGKTCAKSERPLRWNVQGPKGDPGVAGQRGEKGDPGQPGVNGIGTAYISGGRFHNIDLPKANSTIVAELSLPAGKYLISGKVVAEIREQTSAGVVCTIHTANPSSHTVFTGAGLLEDEGIARLAKPLVIQETLSVSDIVVLSEQQTIVLLTCNSAVTGTDSGDPRIAYATRVRLVAMPVDVLDVQPGLGNS